MINKKTDSESKIIGTPQHLRIYVTFASLFVCLQSSILFARNGGELDPGFNDIGFVTTSVTAETEQASDLVIQPDGKIVVVGDARYQSNIDFVVIRYNANGTLDTTFDNDGIVTTAIGSGSEEARAVALQPDGKIVVVGYSDNSMGSDFAVVRYNSDGSLDSTFNGTGKVTTPIGSSFDFAEDVAIQEDGKIVVVGRYSTGSNSNEDFAIARYHADGTLDSTFSFDGKQTTAVGAGKEIANAVLLQPDGKIVVAGSVNTSITSNFEFYDFAAVRYNSNGTLDNSFDYDGMAITSLGSLADFGRDAQLQTDGKIVVTGLTQNSDYDFGTIRYNPDGSLDASFGGGGKVVTNLNGHESANAIAIQSDGKIVTAGSGGGFTLIRYNTDGSLDNDFFGINGIVTKPDGSARAIAIQPDGKIVAAGIGPYNGTFNIRVARYAASASTNQTAVVSGRIVSPFGRGLPRAFIRLTKQNGNTLTVMANSMGYYRFERIEVGQSVTLNVLSNQFYFQPQILTVNTNVLNLTHKGSN